MTGNRELQRGHKCHAGLSFGSQLKAIWLFAISVIISQLRGWTWFVWIHVRILRLILQGAGCSSGGVKCSQMPHEFTAWSHSAPHCWAVSSGPPRKCFPSGSWQCVRKQFAPRSIALTQIPTAMILRSCMHANHRHTELPSTASSTKYQFQFSYRKSGSSGNFFFSDLHVYLDVVKIPYTSVVLGLSVSRRNTSSVRKKHFE